MRPATRRALERAAYLTRHNRIVDAMRLAEPVVLGADPDEAAEIRQWLTDHADDFTGRTEDN